MKNWVIRHAYLIRNLGLPMTVVTVVLLAVSAFIESNLLSGILTDLAITSIGVVVTVFYVEALVENSNEKRWKPYRIVATRRVNMIAARTIENLIYADTDFDRSIRYQAAMEEIRTNSLFYMEYRYRNLEWQTYVRNVAIPNADTFLRCYSYEQIESVRTSARRELEAINELIGLFGDAFSPEQFEHLSNLQMWLRYTTGNQGEYWYEMTSYGLKDACIHALRLIEAGLEQVSHLPTRPS